MRTQHPRIRINDGITAPEVRVVADDGAMLGVLPIAEAKQRAKEKGLDLIEISPKAVPPVAKIMSYGKYQYQEQKREREMRAKAHTTETKSVQITIGTGEHDLELKALRASAWLKEGHRIKVDLFLRGRAKYLEPKFLHERLERFLKLVTCEYKISDLAKKSPKGLSMIIERKK